MAEGEAPVDDRGANVYSDLFTGARSVPPCLQRTAPLPTHHHAADDDDAGSSAELAPVLIIIGVAALGWITFCVVSWIKARPTRQAIMRRSELRAPPRAAYSRADTSVG